MSFWSVRLPNKIWGALGALLLERLSHCQGLLEREFHVGQLAAMFLGGFDDC